MASVTVTSETSDDHLLLYAASLLAMLPGNAIKAAIKAPIETACEAEARPESKPESKPKTAIVGPGKLGSALALALNAAGYSIAEVVFRTRGTSQRRARLLARRVRAQAVPVA